MTRFNVQKTNFSITSVNLTTFRSKIICKHNNSVQKCTTKAHKEKEALTAELYSLLMMFTLMFSTKSVITKYRPWAGYTKFLTSSGGFCPDLTKNTKITRFASDVLWCFFSVGFDVFWLWWLMITTASKKLSNHTSFYTYLVNNNWLQEKKQPKNDGKFLAKLRIQNKIFSHR